MSRCGRTPTTTATKVDVLKSDLEAAATRASEDAAKIGDFQVELQRAKLGSRLSEQARGETEERLMARIEDVVQVGRSVSWSCAVTVPCNLEQ